MNLKSKRTMYRPDGIFSVVSDAASGAPFMVVLEHAYHCDDPEVANAKAAYPGQEWIPKIPPGNFDCRRGEHRLEGMEEPFVTFEITGVAGHTNLLYHWGNFNRNSDGCNLTGEAFVEGAEGLPHEEMVTKSRETFARFMAAQTGLDNFQLTVEA